VCVRTGFRSRAVFALTALVLTGRIRLAMNALRVDIDGPSYRQHIAELRATKPDAAKGAPPAG
jgi:hypothetical protein